MYLIQVRWLICADFIILVALLQVLVSRSRDGGWEQIIMVW